MTTDAAAAFAQVIPTLMIATFLGNIVFHEIPGIIRTLMLYIFVLSVFAEFSILLPLAFGEEVSKSAGATALVSCGMLMLLMTIMIAFKMGTKPQAESDSSQESETKNQ